MTRLVAVLGYSDGRTRGLHPICARRLACAEETADTEDAVLFSGWGRSSSTSEADLMAAAWRPPVARRIVDRGARTTLGNAVSVARAARRLGVEEIVVVTSSWHARRAAMLVRIACAGSGRVVRVVSTGERVTPTRGLRELAAWAVLPILAAIAARNR